MSKQKSKMTQEQKMIHSPSPLHLDACIQGGCIFRNRKKYTRKGKHRLDHARIMKTLDE